MKILFVCENYYPHIGGAEVLFKTLAENYVRCGHVVTVLTQRLPGTAPRETIKDVAIIRVASFSSRYFFTFSSLWHALKQAASHDLIQTTTFNGAVPAWVAGKVRRKPVVITVHEVWRRRWREITGFSWWKSALHEVFERLIYLLSFTHYVCVSQSTRGDLLRTGVPPAKISVVYNGLDYVFWDKSAVPLSAIKAVRKQWRTEKSFIFFAWGRPGSSKGFEYLLQAMGTLNTKSLSHPPARLVLMLGSKQSYRQKYEELRAQAARPGSFVTILDAVPREKLREYVAAADAIVVPSVAEGFGYTALEAVAMGKNVVVSDVGSLPEVISGNHLLFRSKDVNSLVEAMEQAMRGQWQFIPSKRFTWDTCVNSYLDVYAQVLGSTSLS